MKNLRVLKFLFVFVVAAVSTGMSLAGKNCGLSSNGAAAQAESCADRVDESESRGWLGIENRIDQNGRYFITFVYPDSPADLAGMRVGDVIKWVDGIPPAAKSANAAFFPSDRIGKMTIYGIQRENDHLILFAKLVEVPPHVISSKSEKSRNQGRLN